MKERLGRECLLAGAVICCVLVRRLGGVIAGRMATAILLPELTADDTMSGDWYFQPASQVRSA